MAGTLRYSPERLRGRAVLRSATEEHRTATPLELLFDLTFVVAVGRAAASLHHELVERHFTTALVGFALAFFAIWWAWMNATWFASAHDSGDVTHRLLTLVQMVGVLVLAAGVPRAIEDARYEVATAGYVIMRIGLIGGWLRVARDVPDQRTRALRFAGGLVVLQVLWIARLALPAGLYGIAFLLLAIAEMVVPYWAESVVDEPPFHPDHIEERYGLFTIIVLGESILSAAAGFQTAFDEVGLTAGLLAVGLSGIVLAFGTWWLYFDHPGHLTPTPEVAWGWGYAHLGVFASLAALGAGVHVAIEAVTGHASDRVGALAVTLPIAGFMAGLALVMLVTGTPLQGVRVGSKLVSTVVMVVIGLTLPLTGAVLACAAVVLAQVAWMVVTFPGSASEVSASGAAPPGS